MEQWLCCPSPSRAPSFSSASRPLLLSPPPRLSSQPPAPLSPSQHPGYKGRVWAQRPGHRGLPQMQGRAADGSRAGCSRFLHRNPLSLSGSSSVGGRAKHRTQRGMWEQMPALWPALLRALEVVWARRQGERWPAGAGWICTCRTCTPGRKLWPFAPATPGVPIGCQVCCNLPAGFKGTLALEGFLHSCRSI